MSQRDASVLAKRSRRFVSLLWLLVLIACRGGQTSSGTALETLKSATPSLQHQHPRGVVSGILGPDGWQLQVWDAERGETISYVVESGGSLHVTDASSQPHDVVPVLDLATGQMAQVIDSLQAQVAADQVGGAAFRQRTGVKLWSMQLTGQNQRLVWIVQYGAPVITEANRLTVTLDAATGAVV